MENNVGYLIQTVGHLGGFLIMCGIYFEVCLVIGFHSGDIWRELNGIAKRRSIRKLDAASFVPDDLCNLTISRIEQGSYLRLLFQQPAHDFA